MGHLLAIDKGTSVVKCAVIAEDGRELGVARRDTATHIPRPGWHEESLDAMWAAVKALVAQVLRQTGVPADAVDGIGVTAHMGGLILLDRALRPLGPSIIWDDERAGEIVRAWQREGLVDELFAIGGTAPLPGLPVPLLAWFARERPDVLAGAAHLCTTKDYLVLQLTGQLGTDESDAGWFPGDVRARSHSLQVLERCGLGAYGHLLPPVRPSHAVVGQLCREVATEVGLRAGTPVVAGLGDANASTVGVGAVDPGQAATIVGTSLLNNLVAGTPALEPFGIGFVIPTAGGQWLRMLPNTGGGSSNLKWLVAAVYRGEPDPYAALNAEAEQSPLGARGVFYHPYVNPSGVVAPFYHLGARAQFVGLHVGVGRGDLARAVIEGLAFSIRDCYAASTVPVTEVRLSGGAARSRLLCQTVADVLGTPVVVPQGEESALLGVAAVTAWGVGHYPDLRAAAQRFVTAGRVYRPDPGRHDAYTERFSLFQEIRTRMAEVWTARVPFEVGGER